MGTTTRVMIPPGLGWSGLRPWQPIYNSPANDNLPTNNQYTAGWNGVSYDANGNLLNDTFNTYTWDGYGSLASTNGATILYDAFGKMVENTSGAYQFAYSPTGGQPLAVMQAQTVAFGFVPLPGGAFAMYNLPASSNTTTQTGWARRACSLPPAEARLPEWLLRHLEKAMPGENSGYNSPAPGML